MSFALKRVLFFGNPYHKITRSSMFFLRELQQRYEVTEYYLDLWDLIPEELDELAAQRYDFLICWQVMPSRELLDCFQYGKVVMIPMLDHVMAMPGDMENLAKYADLQIFCFSKNMYLYLRQRGYMVKYVQYYPEFRPITDHGDERSLFFWMRRTELPPDDILRRCSSYLLTRVHIHKALDPGQEFRPVSLEHDYEITYSEWFPKKEDMDRVLLQSALYAAPRLVEGIGMSFLGAMAQGRCVIAPNLPTMNEYIIHGKTGILYDYDSFAPLEEFNVREIQNNTAKFMEDGYRQWMSEKEDIFRWIEA